MLPEEVSLSNAPKCKSQRLVDFLDVDSSAGNELPRIPRIIDTPYVGSSFIDLVSC